VIRRIEALNFRCLRDVSQTLEPFQMLVGPNASGKSTFLDCMGFVGDVLQAGPLKATTQSIKGRAPRAADSAHLCWMRQGPRFEIAIELIIPNTLLDKLKVRKHQIARYEIAIDTDAHDGKVAIVGENLWLAPSDTNCNPEPQLELFPATREPRESIVRAPNKRTPEGWRKVVSKNPDSGNDYFQAETTGWNNPFRLGPGKSALANLPEDEERFPVAVWVKRLLLEGISRVELDAQAMRKASPPGAGEQFLPDGSNLPWVVENLREKHSDRFADWVDHLRTGLPDLEDVETVEREDDRNRYLVLKYDNGLTAPSWVISDGTLRMMALTLLAYLPATEVIYLIEEPENGIHPRALEGVFQSLSSVYDGQVLCASHSPVVLGLADTKQLLCFAKDGSGATDIVRGDNHPRLRDWQQTLDLGVLFAAGVLG